MPCTGTRLAGVGSMKGMTLSGIGSPAGSQHNRSGSGNKFAGLAHARHVTNALLWPIDAEARFTRMPAGDTGLHALSSMSHLEGEDANGKEVAILNFGVQAFLGKSPAGC